MTGAKIEEILGFVIKNIDIFVRLRFDRIYRSAAFKIGQIFDISH
jgi:hypothetical protein